MVWLRFRWLWRFQNQWKLYWTIWMHFYFKKKHILPVCIHTFFSLSTEEKNPTKEIVMSKKDSYKLYYSAIQRVVSFYLKISKNTKFIFWIIAYENPLKWSATIRMVRVLFSSSFFLSITIFGIYRSKETEWTARK